MENQTDKENLLKLIKQAIEMLCEKNISSVVILSSYKINSVLKENYGVATHNKLKRLGTNIPKYKLHISKLATLEFHA